MRCHRTLVGCVGALTVVLVVAGCQGTSGGDATDSAGAQVVVTDAASPLPSSSHEPPSGIGDSDTADNTGSTGDSGKGGADSVASATPSARHPLPPGHGVGASAFVGTWQRHLSRLVIAEQPGASTILLGVSAVDVETWAIDWTPQGRGLDITLTRRIEKYGSGVGGLSAGQTFTAELATDASNTYVLTTNGIAGTSGPLTWCKPGQPSPDCGA